MLIYKIKNCKLMYLKKFLWSKHQPVSLRCIFGTSIITQHTHLLLSQLQPFAEESCEPANATP